jgi:hypothetical protein
MRPHSRIETVELIVQTGYTAGQINFPDIPELRSDADKDAVIFAIQTYSIDSVPLSFNGNTTASLAQLKNAFLTLYVTGSEAVFNVPLLKFLNIQNSGSSYYNAREYYECSPLRVDWTKSYIRFATPGTTGTAQYSFIFDFTYEWLPPGSYGKWLQLQNNKFGAGNI